MPEWFLPVAAGGALTLPLVILFTFGDMDTDRFRRENNGGVTLQDRALNDFKRGLTRENFDRVLQRLGVKTQPPPTTARSELGCAPCPSRRSVPSSVRVSPPQVLGRRLRDEQDTKSSAPPPATTSAPPPASSATPASFATKPTEL